MGDVKAKPRATLAVTVLMLAACGPTANGAAKPPTASEILNKPDQAHVKDAHFNLAPHNPRWTVRTSTSSNPSSFKGTDAAYLGEDTLTLGKAWHVKAKDASGSPFEGWVRKSDGYPLKYASTTQASTFTATFDQFNTGQTVRAPPASDVQS